MRILGWEDFEELVLRRPTVGAKTIRLLGERLAVYEHRLSEQIRKEVLARLAGLIFRLSEHRASSRARAAVGYPPVTPTSNLPAW